MRLNRWKLAAAALSVLGVVSTTAYAYTGEQNASNAKLTMQQARAEALSQVHGKIKSAELEKESGGSGLRYSFDIQTKNGVREVGVDAVSGKVLENSADNSQDEAQEARAEHKQTSNTQANESEDQDTDRNGSEH
ncbi:MAG: PepSY domain-containing protein [Salinisphaera sp.]|jgi:hypothetical protein|nr:PepSY domain-containing protein [Salinisphaera sp.]